MRVEKVKIPNTSLLIETNYDYADSFKAGFTDRENKIDILAISKAFFSTSPGWIRKLFALRNRIVSVFGLKTGSKAKYKKELLDNFKGEIGEKVGIFRVFDKSDNEIILGEDDRHLNFRVSLLLIGEKQYEKRLTISTVVNYNNRFGKIYFLPVKPFHKLIVPVMLKNAIKGAIVQSS